MNSIRVFLSCGLVCGLLTLCMVLAWITEIFSDPLLLLSTPSTEWRGRGQSGGTAFGGDHL